MILESSVGKRKTNYQVKSMHNLETDFKSRIENLIITLKSCLCILPCNPNNYSSKSDEIFSYSNSLRSYKVCD